MKHIVMMWLLAATVTSSALAQENNDFSNWRVGLNLANLIQKESAPTIVLDYNFTTNNHARLQLGYWTTSGNRSTDLTNSSTITNGAQADTQINNSPYSSASLITKLAYYRTSDMGDKLNIYYGADLILLQDCKKNEINMEVTRAFSQQQRQTVITNEKTEATTLSYGLAPVFGIQWAFSPRFLITCEAGFEVLNNQFEEKVDRRITTTSSFDPRIFNDQVTGTKSWNQVTSNFNPLTCFILSYRLR